MCCLPQVISYSYRDVNAFRVRENIDHYLINGAATDASNFHKVRLE